MRLQKAGQPSSGEGQHVHRLPLALISDRLGHADVAFILRVYAHLYDDQREEAAFDLSDLFPVAAGGPNQVFFELAVTQ
ncbi:hypothetical protein FNU79_04420 [Deinococcus detaillensis]|uniref:Uncharacterized protein n=1 Tax=Deinococcus detaillensis TaxID=2592048 RepID=A0A553V3Y1_9DEIO|nr:hypothetical protein [Deinococcus detaillensis]TSA87142.1 hypothetical protein FNU79_04420 [Deinococcus detaillensis]